MSSRPVISVFGSNHPVPGEPDYAVAYELGRRLAEAGLTVATGGYTGTMEAVSCGASEAGGHVIGVTCDEIEAWRPGRPNPWVAQEIRYRTMWRRLEHLVSENDGAVALPGGVGTLAEVSAVWNRLQTNAMAPRAFVLLGDFWRRAMEAFVDPAYVPIPHQQLLLWAGTPLEAVEIIQRALNRG